MDESKAFLLELYSVRKAYEAVLEKVETDIELRFLKKRLLEMIDEVDVELEARKGPKEARRG